MVIKIILEGLNMKYTYETDEYIKLLKEYYELEKMAFNSNDSKEYVLGKLEERSRKKKVNVFFSPNI